MKNGLKYETLVLKELHARFGEDLRARPWIRYVPRSRARICQPDALLCNLGGLVIIEIKLSHRPDAEDKLRNLYWPVCEKLKEYEGKEIKLVQICRNLRPADIGLPLGTLSNLTKDYTLIHYPR